MNPTATDRQETVPPPALDIRNLSVEFPTEAGPVTVVRSVDLRVAAGEFMALLGESGSGKSVTARSVLGLVGGGARVSADRIAVGGTDLRGLDDHQLRRMRGNRVALVMQDALSALNPVLSIGDQVAELFRVHRGTRRAAARAQAADLLGVVGIPAPRRRIADYPHQFSGGMRQRILIAMAIALEPELLIADEPTTALDVTVQAQILDLLNDLRDRLGMAVLLITHDLGVVMETSDRLAVMYAGRVVESGPASSVLDRPRHPYTAALLRSVPQSAGRGTALLTIPGTPPSPGAVPSGCAFHPRCDFADDQCRTERPRLLDVSPPVDRSEPPTGSQLVVAEAEPPSPAADRASACHHIDRLTAAERDRSSYASVF